MKQTEKTLFHRLNLTKLTLSHLNLTLIRFN